MRARCAGRERRRGSEVVCALVCFLRLRHRTGSLAVLPASLYSYITPQGMLIGVHTVDVITLFFPPAVSSHWPPH
jgi:hypothetical protein